MKKNVKITVLQFTVGLTSNFKNKFSNSWRLDCFNIIYSKKLRFKSVLMYIYNNLIFIIIFFFNKKSAKIKLLNLFEVISLIKQD